MKRVTKARELNRIANLPEVLPFVAPGFDHVDLTNFIAQDKNFCLRYRGGYMIFAHAGGDKYEGHFLFPAKIRGKRALTSARKIVTHMFTKRGARAIYGDIARTNRAARVFARTLGFNRIGQGRDSAGVPFVRFHITSTEWATLFQD